MNVLTYHTVHIICTVWYLQLFLKATVHPHTAEWRRDHAFLIVMKDDIYKASTGCRTAWSSSISNKYLLKFLQSAHNSSHWSDPKCNDAFNDTSIGGEVSAQFVVLGQSVPLNAFWSGPLPAHRLNLSFRSAITYMWQRITRPREKQRIFEHYPESCTRKIVAW